MTGNFRSLVSAAYGPARRGLGALLLAGVLSAGAGCVTPLKPYLFATPPMARDPIEALAAAFTQNQILAIIVDPQAGLVRSENEVALSLDEQRCVVGQFTLAELEVRGRCEPLIEISAEHKDELHRLGRRMQQAMSIP
jgi:hypothetical protein